MLNGYFFSICMFQYNLLKKDLERKKVLIFENEVVKILFLGICCLNDDFERLHLYVSIVYYCMD